MIELKFAECIAELIVDEQGREDVIGMRFDAIRTLYGTARKYADRGFLSELVEAFFVKKSQMIMKAKSMAEIKKILKPSTPYYNAGKMVPKESPYYVEEEELMLWSITTEKGPLIPAGYERYMELFKKLLPELAGKLWKETA